MSLSAINIQIKRINLLIIKCLILFLQLFKYVSLCRSSSNFLFLFFFLFLQEILCFH